MLKIRDVCPPILAVVLATGCAGLSEQAKMEREALRNKHQAESKVIRKEIKMTLAVGAAAAATAGVVEATDELREAKGELAEAEKNLNEVLK